MKRLSLEPDPHTAWIYDPSHPRYNSDEAKDLRERRARAIASAPRWMIEQTAEECAKICEGLEGTVDYTDHDEYHMIDKCAAEIRRRAA